MIAAAGELERVAWVLSNHDFPRLATGSAPAHARAAAMLLLTLPGSAFIYQGDEIGMADGPGARPPLDRHGRDGFRHPMQWEAEPHGGFTDRVPWLALDRSPRSQRRRAARRARLDARALPRPDRVAARASARDPGSSRSSGSSLASRAATTSVAVNLGDEEAPGPGGEPLLSTSLEHRPGRLAAGEGVVVRDRASAANVRPPRFAAGV